MKADADSAAIYADVISVVESSRPSRKRAKTFTWDEINRMFLNESPIGAALGDKR